MNIFEKFILILQTEMERPNPWGWFHLLCLFIELCLVIVLFFRRHNHSEKQLKIVIGIYGILAFTLELLKQISWSFNYENGVVTWDYQWYAAPFQLCTMPIYICLICLFLKKNRVRDSLFSFLAYTTILGSISTMILPDSCFVRDILVNIHTMWLHLGSFVVSVYLFMSGEVPVNLKSFSNAIIVFIICMFIALGLDLIVYNSGVLNGETFNMFFISPYFNSTLPVFSDIQPKVPYILFLLIYIICITLGSFIIYLIAKLITIINKKIKQ